VTACRDPQLLHGRCFRAEFGNDVADVMDGFRMIEDIASSGGFMKSFNISELPRLRLAVPGLLEAVLDLEDPDVPSHHIRDAKVHNLGVIRNFVTKMEMFLGTLQAFCAEPGLQHKFANAKFCSSAKGYLYFATRGLVKLFYGDTAMGAATLVNHPIFQKVEEDGKDLTILKYLSKIHTEEWENFLERITVSSADEAQAKHTARDPSVGVR
jgi:hypothetical protein